jgi:uncharacterized LabA/DUF88 family protein
MLRKLVKMNIAYIDGQNLHMATKNAKEPWEIDMKRFRRLLAQKYNVEEAYYFIGAYNELYQDLYAKLQIAGFIVQFRLHGIKLKSNKKGNVDVDIAFTMMRDLVERPNEYDGAVLVSNDGDYYRVAEYLLSKGKLARVLLPSERKASSLYKRLSSSYYSYLDTEDMRVRIGK